MEKSQKPDNTTTTTPDSNTPGAHNNTGLGRNALAGLIIGGLLLLAIAAGSVLYAVNSKSDNNPANTTTSQQPSGNNSPNPNPAPLKTGIVTEVPEFEAQLDSIKSDANSVTLNFSAVCTNPKDGVACENILGLWFVDELDETYIVDDANQQKYEIIKDANGNALVSRPTTVLLKKGEKVSYYAQVTAPPKGSVVSVHLPDVRPIPDITIN